MTKRASTGVGVFLKWPQPGKVKTRLAQHIGPQKAAETYKKLLAHIFTHSLTPLDPASFTVTLFCDPFVALEKYQAEFGRDLYLCVHQQGNDLGERLTSAFANLLQHHDRALIIGSDCIEISPALFAQAAKALSSGADTVLGPSLDGGYYLVGLSSPKPFLFDGIPWSTETVFEKTVAKAKTQGLSIHELPKRRDIDTLSDLQACGLA